MRGLLDELEVIKCFSDPENLIQGEVLIKQEQLFVDMVFYPLLANLVKYDEI